MKSFLMKHDYMMRHSSLQSAPCYYGNHVKHHTRPGKGNYIDDTSVKKKISWQFSFDDENLLLLRKLVVFKMHEVFCFPNQDASSFSNKFTRNLFYIFCLMFAYSFEVGFSGSPVIVLDLILFLFSLLCKLHIFGH